MKKVGIIFGICTMLFSMSGLAQIANTPYLVKEMNRQNEIQLKTGIVGSYPRHTEEFTWDTDWVAFRTIETSYTTFGEPSAIEVTQGTNKSRDLFSYDGQHNQTEKKSQVWSGTTWVDTERWTSSFNAAGYEIESRQEQWNGSAWDLKEGNQVTIAMDGNRIGVATIKEWNIGSQTWDNSSRNTYSYTGTGIYFTSVIVEVWAGGWVNNLKMEYSWTGDKLTETIAYEYQNNTWVRVTKMTETFPDAFTSVMLLSIDDENGGWMDGSRTTTKVDSHGNVVLEQMEMNIGSWAIFMSTRFTLTYSGNNLTQRITETFAMGTDWEKTLKEVFSNFASLGTGVNVLPENSLSVFPNPAGKDVVVHLSMLNPGSVTLTLFSLTGQSVLEESFVVGGSDINHQLNLSRVLPGSYLLIARDKQGNEIGKTRLIRE